MSQSDLEADFERRLRLSGLPMGIPQYPFAKAVGRRHRFDRAWPERRLAVEIDGGVHLAKKGFAVGHHASLRDYRKRNLAVKLGWKILAYRPEMIRSGDAIFDLALILNDVPEPEAREAITKREAWLLAQESAIQRRKKLSFGAPRRGR